MVEFSSLCKSSVNVVARLAIQDFGNRSGLIVLAIFICPLVSLGEIRDVIIKGQPINEITWLFKELCQFR